VDTPEVGHARRFEAHQSVLSLIYGYSRLVDRGDFDAVGDLFARGTFSVSADRVLTGMAVGARLRRRLRVYEDGTPRTVHMNPNVAITFSDDLSRAEAFTPVQVFQEIEGEIKCIYLGHYDDAFEADGSRWHFASRVAVADLVGDMSAHFIRSPGAEAPQPPR
jgi:hypothetical protein